MMTTLTPPTSGTAKVGGHDVVTDADGVRHATGAIPQALTSDPELIARDAWRSEYFVVLSFGGHLSGRGISGLAAMDFLH